MKFPVWPGILSLLLLLSCDLRRPDDGYDPDWQPDHSAPAQPSGQDQDPPGTAAAGTDVPGASDAERKRPSAIAADTAQMQKVWDTWEMAGVEKTEYTAYFSKKQLALIVEKTSNSTRSYYFDRGAFYYFNETSDDGSTSLTVEFDDIGDVLGARKTIDGEPAHPEGDDYSEIVEHAVELKIAAEE